MQRTLRSDAADGGVTLGLLDRAADAFPAAVEMTDDGWRWRYSDSSMWWAGATLAHGGATNKPLDERVQVAEAFYAACGAPARFQVCPDCPPDLDATLAARDYAEVSPMSLQLATTTSVIDQLRPEPLQVCVDVFPTATWFDIWYAVHAAGSDPGPQWRLLSRVERPSCYVSVLRYGQPVAVGRAVADTGWAGIFGMATLPHARGRGAGTAVLAALARWARDQRAARLYLQIDEDNAAAQRLYAAAGFTQLVRYHYRVAG